MGTPLLWTGFLVTVVLLVAWDLFLARGRTTDPTPAEATRWSLLYIALSLGFAGLLYFLGGFRPAATFLTGYVVEYALSVDNLFVFLLIFSHFRITGRAQQRLLYWGVLGAVLMRAGLIWMGAALVSRFHFMFYIFGGLLLYSALRLLLTKEDEAVDPEQGAVVRWARRLLPISRPTPGFHFITQEDGRYKLTPVFLVLVVVELSDLLFALDSIPAILGITQDPFIVFTSNVCAVMGLRSLFFLVSSLMSKFAYLKQGLAVILAFVGLKLISEAWFGHQLKEYETLLIVGSLSFIALTLVVSVVASHWFPPERKLPQASQDSAET